jgi:hypothetical protein
MRRWDGLSVVRVEIVGCDRQHLVRTSACSIIFIAGSTLEHFPAKISVGSVKPIVLLNWDSASEVIFIVRAEKSYLKNGR